MKWILVIVLVLVIQVFAVPPIKKIGNEWLAVERAAYGERSMRIMECKESGCSANKE